VFQFCAGDLYAIIPILTKQHQASQKINGECKATTSNLKLIQSEGNKLLLSMHYVCSLAISGKTVSEFDIDPNFVI
jgi:hypothetical protein